MNIDTLRRLFPTGVLGAQNKTFAVQTATAVPVYINTSYATDLDLDATATQTLTGTVVITWLNLGDY